MYADQFVFSQIMAHLPMHILRRCVRRYGGNDGPLTIKRVTQHLASYEFFYNYQRPHASLAYQTPNEYIVALEAA